jgi:hypothetical protein
LSFRKLTNRKILEKTEKTCQTKVEVSITYIKIEGIYLFSGVFTKFIADICNSTEGLMQKFILPKDDKDSIGFKVSQLHFNFQISDIDDLKGDDV